MQRRAPRWLAIAAVLYGAFAGFASAEPLSTTATASRPPVIALLLPTKAKQAQFATVSDAIIQGALSAEKIQGNSSTPLLKVYATTEVDADITRQYRQALNDGAAAVIGPLTRTAIRSIASEHPVPVPVLSLNNLENDTPAQAQLFSFALSIDNETEQVAERMRQEGIHNPLVLATEAPLSKKMQAAFVRAWEDMGHKAPPVMVIDKTSLASLKASIDETHHDAIFMAADIKRARQVRPYVGNSRPVYATSQVFSGRFGKTAGNLDLLGVRFMDMPWLLTPQEAAIAIYPRSEKTLNADLERLYALGIDAYRVVQLLLINPSGRLELDGVTGKLSLTGDNVVERQLLPGEVGADAPGEPATGMALPPATPLQ